MKILHISSHFHINYRYQDYYLMKEQILAEHEVYMITSDRNYPFPACDKKMLELYGRRYMECGEFIQEGIHVIRLHAFFEYRTRVWLKGLKRKIEEISPDIIISHGVFHFTTMQILRMRKMCSKLILDDHMLVNETPNTIFAKISYNFFKFLFRKQIANKVDKVISVASGCYPNILRYGVFPEKIHSIYLGVDSQYFHYEEEYRHRFRTENDIQEDVLVITSTGKMYDRKNTHLIFDALNRIDTNQKILILLVGAIQSEYYKEMSRAMSDSKFKYKLLPMQEQEGLRAVYCASDVIVWPDSATISTLEASACERPVIVGTHITERCSYGNGIVINHGNIDELTIALIALINNKYLRELMGKQGRLLVEREHKWDIIAQRFIE